MRAGDICLRAGFDSARPPLKVMFLRAATLECFARYFGERARRPVQFFEQDWAADPWASGCIPCWSPGVMTGYGATLGDALGPVHWAGSETSEEWDGYMEGAVRAGERAAAEVLAALPRERVPA